MIDYHVHTSLCNHADGTMAAFIKRAVQAGLREICFLDHLTIDGSPHPLSMTPEEIPFYLQAVRTLKQGCRGIIDVKAGLEVDFNPEKIDIIQEITDTYAFDVIGSSVHFAGGWNLVSRRTAHEFQNEPPDHLYEIYLEQLEKMMTYDYFDMVCHIDVIKKFGRKPSKNYDDDFNRILTVISDKDLTVEVNAAGYTHPAREQYPSMDILKECHKKGIPVTSGSDAHSPEEVGRHLAETLSVIQAAGYTEISGFKRRERYEIPINNDIAVPTPELMEEIAI